MGCCIKKSNPRYRIVNNLYLGEKILATAHVFYFEIED